MRGVPQLNPAVRAHWAPWVSDESQAQYVQKFLNGQGYDVGNYGPFQDILPTLRLRLWVGDLQPGELTSRGRASQPKQRRKYDYCSSGQPDEAKRFGLCNANRFSGGNRYHQPSH